jgi:hypothetical protein
VCPRILHRPIGLILDLALERARHDFARESKEVRGEVRWQAVIGEAEEPRVGQDRERRCGSIRPGAGDLEVRPGEWGWVVERVIEGWDRGVRKRGGYERKTSPSKKTIQVDYFDLIHSIRNQRS